MSSELSRKATLYTVFVLRCVSMRNGLGQPSKLMTRVRFPSPAPAPRSRLTMRSSLVEALLEMKPG